MPESSKNEDIVLGIIQGIQNHHNNVRNLTVVKERLQNIHNFSDEEANLI